MVQFPLWLFWLIIACEAAWVVMWIGNPDGEYKASYFSKAFSAGFTLFVLFFFTSGW